MAEKRGFKWPADDWGTQGGKMSEAEARALGILPPETGEQSIQETPQPSREDQIAEIVRVHAEMKEAQKPKWIETLGADLSGHDFGCEFVWLVIHGEVHGPFKTKELKPILLVDPDSRDWRATASDPLFWGRITHWMPTDIKTPDAP